ncbi:MAG: biotin/lipoyl-binding protein [Bryobacteraceae bacterium]|jgi:multidrug resistance efflux pump
MQGKWALLAVVAVLVGVAGGALSLRRRSPAPPVRAPGAALLPANEVTLSGAIRPQHVTSVGAQVNGIIDALPVDVGQDVYQGQVLARIGSQGLESAREAASSALDHAQERVSRAENAVAAARLEQSRTDAEAQRARSAMDRAESVWSRQQLLFSQGATPRLTYEKAQSEYDSARALFEVMDKAARTTAERVQSALQEVASAQNTLADENRRLEDSQAAFEAADVRSPVDGLLVGRKGEVGKPAQAFGNDLFQIATDTYALEVALEPTPPILKRIRPGQPALVLIPDLESAGIPGDVKEIQGTLVLVEFNSTIPAIRPGMVADVRLKLD